MQQFIGSRECISLLSFFSILVAIKLILGSFILSPHIVVDEHLLFIEARRIFFEHTYFINDAVRGAQYPPLYPLVISPATASQDALRWIICINSFLSSSVVFPLYYLARKYLPEDRSMMATVVGGLLPPYFTYTFTIMAENLFFPLVLASIYFLKRVTEEDDFRNNLLCGIFISLAVMTKLTGVVLLGVFILVKLKMLVVGK